MLKKISTWGYQKIQMEERFSVVEKIRVDFYFFFGITLQRVGFDRSRNKRKQQTGNRVTSVKNPSCFKGKWVGLANRIALGLRITMDFIVWTGIKKPLFIVENAWGYWWTDEEHGLCDWWYRDRVWAASPKSNEGCCWTRRCRLMGIQWGCIDLVRRYRWMKKRYG